MESYQPLSPSKVRGFSFQKPHQGSQELVKTLPRVLAQLHLFLLLSILVPTIPLKNEKKTSIYLYCTRFPGYC
jgi:hypothetical protein